MTRMQSRINKRSAFTLIELMVVILIIAILASLLASAVVKAMGKIPEVKTRTEISEMEQALQAFMTDYSLTDPPPSVLVLREYVGPAASGGYPAGDPSYAFLQKVFGKNLIGTGPTGVPPYWVDWNGDGKQNGPWTLEGEQCLVFYIGGIPNAAAVVGGSSPGPQGFSTNNMNPSTPGGKRRGPYFPFDPNRLFPQPVQVTATWNGFFMYIDPWRAKSGPYSQTLGGTPYAYFSSLGLNNTGYAYNYAAYGYSIANNMQACQSIGAGPYAIRAATPPLYPLTGQFSNSNTYQIISAGKDGYFGNTGWIPSSGLPPIPPSNANAANQPAGNDDQTNFSSTLLGIGQN